MLMEHAAQPRHLRAPQRDGETLVDPPRPLLAGIVADNRELLARAECDLFGRSLADLAAAARHGLFERAIAHTSQYRGIPAETRRRAARAGAPFVLSGHQPQLFHPGVWYKNFVLGSLAREVGGVGIHLLIDSDMCRGVSIRVPSGTLEEPHAEAISYDEPAAEVPYEERTIRDPAAFASFSDRVLDRIKSLVPQPMVRELWPLTVERNRGQMNLGLRLAQGRHAYEETWENDTLELPQSSVCGLPEFAWFVAHLLAHLPRFWTAHNDALASYRKVNHLRNRAQPVPDLAESGGWLEAPFWIWSAEDPQRRPLFAQQRGEEIVLTDRHKRTVMLTLTADRDPTNAVEQLMDAADRGIKIRTRALATTLFARLVLSDLFLHGIGGAKYDQVTDRIAADFFGFDPPQFATVSATLRLPFAQRSDGDTQNGHWRQQSRELTYHPERYLTQDGSELNALRPEALNLVETKRRWVHTAKTPGNARERHLAIAAANKSLQPFVANERRQIELLQEDLQRRQRAGAILDSRDYSFCLFPRQHFNRLLLDESETKP